MTVKICCICEFENAKYRCPKCNQFFCSVTCYNKHKQNCIESIEFKNCDLHEGSIEKTNVIYNFCTEDTISVKELEKLYYSEELKNCLKSCQVRDIIAHVLNNRNPTKAIKYAMKEPLFVKLVDICLKIVKPSDEKKSH